MKYIFATVTIVSFVWTFLLSILSINDQTSMGIGIGITCAGFAVATAMLWRR